MPSSASWRRRQRHASNGCPRQILGRRFALHPLDMVQVLFSLSGCFARIGWSQICLIHMFDHLLVPCSRSHKAKREGLRGILPMFPNLPDARWTIRRLNTEHLASTSAPTRNVLALL
ncbi:hypothetical protein LY78DRAFT_409524 [Colletotrichum sublineola]|nr:hypothetical protein LY78DRAFT_409524 [Colletotrichum sublineola]